MRMLDLFCGRGGWTNAFLERGWECVGIDLIQSPDYRGKFIQCDVRNVCFGLLQEFDFVCASSPCEQFSVHGMPHFHPDPPYPEIGIQLFNHTRAICEAAQVPYVMENVRSAEKFVGKAVHHCGPYYLWGTGVPILLMQGITKGMKIGGGAEALKIKQTLGREALRNYRREHDILWQSSKSAKRKAYTAGFATIPPELAGCVAEYAERLLAQ